MQPTIEPYEFMFIKNQINQLINAYQSVNDRQTIATFEALVRGKISAHLKTDYPEVEELLENVMQVGMTKAKAALILEDFKEFVIPFKKPSSKQVEKVFRKVKKLKEPAWSHFDLRENTYVGWTDPGSQKKFLLLYQDQRLVGINGSFSPNVKKGICPLCQTEGNVALFMATTKTTGDGAYTKNGNYICVDSQLCNQQMTERSHLDYFVNKLQEK